MISFNRQSGLAATLVLLATSLPSARANPTEVALGHLATTRGEVYVDGTPSKSGTPVFAKSKIKTGNGKTAVLLAGEAVIQLGFDSELEIKNVLKTSGKETNAEVELAYGQVRTLLKDRGTPKRLMIRTKTGVMGVRGTEVFVDSPKSGSQPAFFATVEGKAELTPTTTTGGAPAVTIPLPQNQAYGGAVGGAQTLNASEARAMASNVAPPRAETFTVSETLNAASNGSESSRPTAAQAPQATGPRLDPVVNSGTAAAEASKTGSALLVPTNEKL